MVYSRLWEDRLQMDASSVPVGKMGGPDTQRQTDGIFYEAWSARHNFLEIPNRR